MIFVWIFGALAVTAAGALLLVERKIRLRTRRVRAEQPAVDPQAERVIELRMRHLSTGFADGMPLPVTLEPAGEILAFVTAQALFIGGLAIPLASVDDASIRGGALRLWWRRGGELLETLLEAPVHDLERLRREIHLRQPNVLQKLVEMVAPK